MVMKQLFSYLLVIGVFSSCSLLDVSDDTYNARYPSKGLDKPKDLITNEALKSVASPTVKPVVAVYSNAFTDQTGQRKSNSEFALFSTALTQAPENLLIKALKETSNGDFWIVVERVGLDNLTKERQLIRSTREQLTDKDGNKPSIMPLLFAGVLMQGAIVSYETNLVSGGVGARYLGIGSSEMYRTDNVTVSLRMISTNTGEILIEKTKSKTIYSHGRSQDVFRFVSNAVDLVEIETGRAENESGTIALQKAIESALLDIVNIGYERGYWKYE
jgi:curli production assembly/transport component CsgG